MKGALTIIVVALLFVGVTSIPVLAGCGGEKTSTTEEETITEKDEEVTSEDETKVSTEGISEKDIGVPIYPGAETGEDDASFLATKKGEVSLVTLYTDDDVGKVISWYKDKLSGKSEFVDSSMTIDGEKMGLYFFEEGGEEKAITIMGADPGDPGKTTIIITSQ